MNGRRNAASTCLRLTLAGAAGLVAAGAYAPAANAAGTPLKVSCIGEQSTHSDLFPLRTNQPPGMQEYPAMLQTLLGSGYNVMNYGDCCASVISGYTTSETHPYISGNQFQPSIDFMPDIVIIGSWGRHDWGMSAQNALAAFKAGDTTTDFTKFQTDYDTLVSKYIAAASKPKIFCSTPIPIPFGNDGPDDGYKTSPAAAAITAVCTKYNLPIIDLFTIFTGHKEYYINPPDKDSEGEHTSAAGDMVIAQAVFDAITGVDGGILAVAPFDDGGTATQAGPGGDDASASGGSGSGGSTVAGSSGSSSGGGSTTTATDTSTTTASGSSSGSSAGSGGAASTAGTSGTPGTTATTGTDTSTDTGGSVAPSGSSGGQNSAEAPNNSGSGGCTTAPGTRAPADFAVALVLGGLALRSRRKRGQSIREDTGGRN